MRRSPARFDSNSSRALDGLTSRPEVTSSRRRMTSCVIGSSGARCGSVTVSIGRSTFEFAEYEGDIATIANDAPISKIGRENLRVK